MPFMKRKYSSMARGAKAGRLGMQTRYARTGFKKVDRKVMNLTSGLSARVNRIERTIETKESLVDIADNVALAHNNITLIRNNLLATNTGAADPMAAIGQRVGDRITIKGLSIKLFLQNQAQRPRVFYRIMVVKSARGDTPTRATLFKGLSANKMIDQVNTERYTIVAQRVFTVTAQGAMAWTSASVPAGYPLTINGADAIGGVGTKIVNMWIPGRKLCRKGILQYENETSSPKFFDYNVFAMAYDWFGTPQDVNNVGAVSDGWCKLYYKDA